MRKINNSISKRLTKSFAVLLSCMVAINLISVAINLKTVNQYNTIINNLVLVGQVQSKTGELINTYNTIIGSTKPDKQLYEKKYAEIQGILAKLDKAITYDKSKLEYSGLKNILDNINKDSNSGFAKLGTEHALDTQGIYTAILKEGDFVTKSVGIILVDE